MVWRQCLLFNGPRESPSQGAGLRSTGMCVKSTRVDVDEQGAWELADGPLTYFRITTTSPADPSSGQSVERTFSNAAKKSVLVAWTGNVWRSCLYKRSRSSGTPLILIRGCRLRCFLATCSTQGGLIKAGNALSLVLVNLA